MFINQNSKGYRKAFVSEAGFDGFGFMAYQPLEAI